MSNEIEVLIMLNIPPDNFLNSLIKSTYVKSIYDSYNKKTAQNKKNVYYLNYGKEQFLF